MLEAAAKNGDERNVDLDLAIHHYRMAGERHPYDPVSYINIATIQTDRGNYPEAERVFSAISSVAESREKWFRMHSKWAEMQLKWAVSKDQAGEKAEVENHYLRSLDLFRQSKEIGHFDLNQEWLIQYTKALLMYARFLDSCNRFDDAREIFDQVRKLANWANNSKYTGFHVERARHYYSYARYLWFNRKPEEAAKAVKSSLGLYKSHQQIMKGKVNEAWRQGYKDAKEMDDFFINTGIGQQRKGLNN